MIALFINIKIDDQEKFEILKYTILDIEKVFNECHIKIRGKYKEAVIIFLKKIFLGRVNFYQEVQEKNWIAASLEMFKNIKSSTVFIYNEDHKLIANLEDLNLIIRDFNKYQLDYLCYSFFRASRLSTNNLLPLNPNHRSSFSEFFLNDNNARLLKKISPLFFPFSLTSICSRNYLEDLLIKKNKKFKIYSKIFTTLLQIFFSFPRYRIVVAFLNYFLSFINIILLLYPANTPFNLEESILEIDLIKNNKSKKKWKFGILKSELFANLDDDNGAYGESLIKRGLYPFDLQTKVNPDFKNSTNFVLQLSKNDFYDCTYYSQALRIRKLPKVSIKVNYGKIKVFYNDKNIILKKNNYHNFYSNLSPVIKCLEESEIKVSVFDEIID
jgi:hypothetical protein